MHVTRQYRAYSFSKPIDSCHFGLVYRRKLILEELCISTGTTMKSQLLQSNRLYCNYDNTTARMDRRCLQWLAFLSMSSTSSSIFAVPFTFVFRTKVGRKLRRFLRSSWTPPRSREGGPVVTQCASQNSYYIRWSRNRLNGDLGNLFRVCLALQWRRTRGTSLRAKIKCKMIIICFIL